MKDKLAFIISAATVLFLIGWILFLALKG